ncbi:MAG: cell wall hydrolase [Nitrospinota bacterium]|nr:cell wall hydrolase [Nitrospinota bacterium]
MQNSNKIVFVIILLFVFFCVFYILSSEVDKIQKKEEIFLLKVLLKQPKRKLTLSEKVQIRCLATNIYFEARNQNLKAKVAVGLATLNRVMLPDFPSTICKVVKEGPVYPYKKSLPLRNKCQFSWYCDGKSDEIQLANPKERKAWESCFRVSQNLYINRFEFLDFTNGATHYHADYVIPRWTKDTNILFLEKFGTHLFYKYK